MSQKRFSKPQPVGPGLEEIERIDVEPIRRTVDIEVYRTEINEKVIEVSHRQLVERIEEVPSPIKVEKEVPMPKVNVVERVIQIPKEVQEEVIIEVPEVQVVEKIVEIPQWISQEKVVEKPVVIIQERIIPIPKRRVEERIVEVPREEYERMIPQGHWQQPQQPQAPSGSSPGSAYSKADMQPGSRGPSGSRGASGRSGLGSRGTPGSRRGPGAPPPSSVGRTATGTRGELDEGEFPSEFPSEIAGPMSFGRSETSYVIDMDEHGQPVYREAVSDAKPQYKHVPKPVEIPVTHYTAAPIERLIHRNVPVPVEVHVVQEFICPQLIPIYKEVPMVIPIEAAIEQPVPADAVFNTQVLEAYLERQEHGGPKKGFFGFGKPKARKLTAAEKRLLGVDGMPVAAMNRYDTRNIYDAGRGHVLEGILPRVSKLAVEAEL
ncbi:MAG: uncharacterized protein KVP18_001956 [Porospora cf. gigantea A]|uniref:uncharacterized protein n=1 Tax=Porospora cf. gigantea A TaxID=2853593 RepID=UPI00355A00F7|nr:MAG: hypothetical protein KVP18_001956 [Porospora cf. gigantea A]